MLQCSPKWKETYPGAVQGVLVMKNVTNPSQHDGLDGLKVEFEQSVRRNYAGYTRAMLQELPTIKPYVTYYKHFDKSYHVLFQLESIITKGKNIPKVSALVEAMFLAELKNHLLTAEHDLDALRMPVRLDVAGGSEQYTQLNGQVQILKAGDMFVRDETGVISSILYGPDQRTAITPSTQRVMFVVYAPVGISCDWVEAHLQDICRYVQLVSPAAEVTSQQLLTASEI